jgi:UPF0176 protein
MVDRQTDVPPTKPFDPSPHNNDNNNATLQKTAPNNHRKGLTYFFSLYPKMWTLPSLEEIETTLRDPSSPIGKRMRAAYYAKQHFLDDRQNESDDDDEGPSIPEKSQRILDVLCEQVYVKEHGSLLRHEFAYVLGQMACEQACVTLERLLRKDDDCVMVRHEAAEALGAIASPRSVQVLQETRDRYQGTCDELSDTCLLALNRIQATDEDDDSNMAVGCACMLAPFSSIDPVKADPLHAHLSTLQIGDILCDISAPLLERYRAMFSLRNRGGEDSVLQLCRALVQDTSSPLLRHEVAFVLGQLQHPSSIDALVESLSRKDEHTMVRHESAEALGAIEGNAEEWNRIETTLLNYQQDSDRAVADSCIVALDAADYFGNHVTAEDGDVDEDDDPATESTPATSFGQQKRASEVQANCARKQVLAQHFNVLTETTSHTTNDNKVSITVNPYRVLALYKFVSPKISTEELPTLQAEIEETCRQHKALGTLLLAEEGINGTICYPLNDANHDDDDDKLLDFLQHKFNNSLRTRVSKADRPVFARLKIKIKKEIVTMHRDDTAGSDAMTCDPSKMVGEYVKPQDWNRLLLDPDTLVVDTRNQYEIDVGTFRNAVNPHTQNFVEFPDWMKQNVAGDKAPKKIAMFCTGGIRCEKATNACLQLVPEGVPVYHLEGGILAYLNDIPPEESLFDGDCYVFDQRVAVTHGLKPSTTYQDSCHGCRHPLSKDDMARPDFVDGVSCRYCANKLTEEQRERYQSRQRQIDLAKKGKPTSHDAFLRDAPIVNSQAPPAAVSKPKKDASASVNNAVRMKSTSSSNAKVIESLSHLIDYVKNDKSCSTNPPTLSHYRDIPEEVQKAYTLIDNGAQMIHSTATKYTLVGKINLKDQVKLGTDLLRGCELIGAALHVLLQDHSGCSRAVRHLTQRAALAIFINVLHLVEAFEDGSALDGNVGAQMTGAVWEACDEVLNKLLPKGNRNAIRRELFTWQKEIQDTMEEFQDMIDLGPADGIDGNDDAGDEEDEDDFFGMDGEEQYDVKDFPIAKACLHIIKNSRGNMKIAVETCEVLGEKHQAAQDDGYLASILQVLSYARSVGEGVTDLGSLLYPPICDNLGELQSQVAKQMHFIKALQEYILGLEGMPSKITELASILSHAIDARQEEFDQAVVAAGGNKST